MPTISLRSLCPSQATSATLSGSLPSVIQTKGGLALVEIQGTLHVDSGSVQETVQEVKGKLEFGEKVYLSIGNQRLAGEVKKLNKSIAVVRRCGDNELEIKDIISHKVVFTSRPEPVS
ncbi:hypothetical protein K470DRAFT_221955 [Piedraia hortae CBS 480.64]|uniref:Uncharacterized protein n=1 Tax=Piedraia hortae CBS 480.64 TaxID=1314780 RepID=A0A6A7BSN2_9PEZI|nr:hypothetical protein K470DRAFT_221955 [Piedraia hortae CBS 480.64]